ncbi:acid phosphatase [Aureococcus anophagefferens]|nr:acid phosphatase [Aureococcus anophagefferens]
MASLARRVACKKNPALATWVPPGGADPVHLNPCCVPRLCVSEISCYASSSTCPFVTGIGRHTSSMANLVDMPCCAREWFAKTRTSFFRSAAAAHVRRGDAAAELRWSRQVGAARRQQHDPAAEPVHARRRASTGATRQQRLYGLRPGLWGTSSERFEGRGTKKFKHYSFREFAEAEEYRDIATKMFGDPTGCDKRADARSNCSASLFAVHWTHVPKAGGTAMASLARRVACKKNPPRDAGAAGADPAYNSPRRLALREFDVAPASKDRDFMASRSSGS